MWPSSVRTCRRLLRRPSRDPDLADLSLLDVCSSLTRGPRSPHLLAAEQLLSAADEQVPFMQASRC